MSEAILIAGGGKTRLQELNKQNILDTQITLLDKQIRRLNNSGVFKITLSLGFGAEQIKKHISDKYRTCQEMFTYITEKKPLGTAGWMHLTPKRKKPVFVMNADDVLKYDMIEMLKQHLSHPKYVATIAAVKVDHISNCGSITNKDLLITSFNEKTGEKQSGLISAGQYVFSPRIWDYLPKKKIVSLEKDVFPKLAEKGLLACYIIK